MSVSIGSPALSASLLLCEAWEYTSMHGGECLRFFRTSDTWLRIPSTRERRRQKAAGACLSVCRPVGVYVQYANFRVLRKLPAGPGTPKKCCLPNLISLSSSPPPEGTTLHVCPLCPAFPPSRAKCPICRFVSGGGGSLVGCLAYVCGVGIKLGSGAPRTVSRRDGNTRPRRGGWGRRTVMPRFDGKKSCPCVKCGSARH